MSKGRPFFKINDDKGNPINQSTEQALGLSSRSGREKGNSKSIDPTTGKKYPRGFTPPVDFYFDQNPIINAKSEGDFSDPGLDIGKAGTDPNTGRPIEYGQSITQDTSDGIKIKNSGNNAVTEMTQPSGPFTGTFPYTSPAIKIDLEKLKPYERYLNPENVSLETNLPVEYGTRTIPKGLDGLEQSDKLGLFLTKGTVANETGRRYQSYNYFDDYVSKKFVHLLDFFIDNRGGYSIPKVKSYGIIHDRMQNPQSDGGVIRPWLGGQFFYKTFEENEDPTILGVDIEFKLGGSPIFNGNLIEFLKLYGENYKEISSRIDIHDKFCQQIFRFIPVDQPSAFRGSDQKIYYLQNIKGLEKLVERDGGSESKYFVDYQKDLITLEFIEDVTQNMGYLAQLYKTLSYSRINGKQLIPKNLLRFDIDITITEMRNYQRSTLGNTDKEKVLVFADKISQYKYSLYECQFIFDKMPHTEAVSNSKTEALNSYEISFDYKFSTLNFKKYTGKFGLDKYDNGTIQFFSIDNKQKSVSTKTQNEKLNRINSFPNIPETKKLAFGEGDMQIDPNNQEELIIDEVENNRVNNQINQDSLALVKTSAQNAQTTQQSQPQSTKPSSRFKIGAQRAFDQLKTGLKRAAVMEVNRQIITQAALLNKTIENIRNAIPFAGRMSEPTNVYTGTNAFRNDLINAFRSSVGASIKSFFQKP